MINHSKLYTLEYLSRVIDRVFYYNEDIELNEKEIEDIHSIQVVIVYRHFI